MPEKSKTESLLLSLLKAPLFLINFFLVKTCSFLLIVWKRCFSPLFGPMCRFTPTCSEYARQALEDHGFFKGAFLATKRVMRCNPLFNGGDDPVPKSKGSE